MRAWLRTRTTRRWGAAPGLAGVCGTARSAPPDRFTHVVVIVFENHSYGDILGPPGSPAAQAAPFMNRLAADCGTGTNYHSITHPSLPNYLALTAGSTFGVTSDCHCTFPIGGIFRQAALAGRSWNAYAEDMPSPCYATSASGGLYTQRHNVPVLYQRLAATCVQRDLPLGSTSSGPLASALSCHVTLVVVSRYTRPGTVVNADLSHYSLLRTSDVLLGLAPLRNAASVRGAAADFNL